MEDLVKNFTKAEFFDFLYPVFHSVVNHQLKVNRFFLKKKNNNNLEKNRMDYLCLAVNHRMKNF